MEKLFRAKDGAEFDSEEMCKKHEEKLDILYSYFEKMQMGDILKKIEIKPFFHNEQISDLSHGKVDLDDWKFKNKGFCIMKGRMGNPNTYIVMQLQDDFKTIHFYKADFDDDEVDHEGYKYLTSIPVSIIDELYFSKE